MTEGIRKSFQNINCKMANRSCYGYDTTPSGGLILNESEAKIVRWIFKRYLAGDSLSKITTGLQKRSILVPSGKLNWNREAISKFKYAGSVLLQKTVSFCSFCGAQIKNEREN